MVGVQFGHEPAMGGFDLIGCGFRGYIENPTGRGHVHRAPFTRRLAILAVMVSLVFMGAAAGDITPVRMPPIEESLQEGNGSGIIALTLHQQAQQIVETQAFQRPAGKASLKHLAT